jgi:hypothetical protein
MFTENSLFMDFYKISSGFASRKETLRMRDAFFGGFRAGALTAWPERSKKSLPRHADA